MTDHRIGLTLYNLPQVMEGGIDPVIAALQKADYEEKLAALTGQTYAPARGSAGRGLTACFTSSISSGRPPGFSSRRAWNRPG